MNDDPSATRQDLELTRWIDQLPDAPPPAGMDLSEATRHRAATQAVAALLRQHAPTRLEPPYPDFFNTQLLKKIRDEQAVAAPRPAAPAATWFSSLARWLHNPWLTGGATAALTTAAIFSLQPAPGSSMATGTRVLTVFSPEPNAITRVIPAPDQSAVIISLDGLEPVPADRQVVGRLSASPQSLLAAVHP